MAPSSNQTMVPYISMVIQMISDLSMRIELLEDSILWLSGRVLDLERELRRLVTDRLS